jgi:carbon-monoxide dehydrogenase large subunit
VGAMQSVGATLWKRLFTTKEHNRLLGRFTITVSRSLVTWLRSMRYTLETQSPFSLNGAKGVGESGTIPMPAAIANAVHDAFGGGRGLCVLPLMPERVFQYLREGERL